MRGGRPDPRREAVASFVRWRNRPSAFVREVLGATPDRWQRDLLDAYPKHPRTAMIACVGPGKSTALAWIILNFLVTRPHPRVAVASITQDNLRTNLWSEIAKWLKRSPLLEQTLEWKAERVSSREHPETWYAVARSWARSADPEHQGLALAGIHADYTLFVLDEAGGIPDAVAATAEGALAAGVESHLVVAGNPTHRSGPLFRAATSERRQWNVYHVTGDPDDPNRAPRVSIDWARDMIEKHGRSNPWVQARVLGQFPETDENALITLSDFEDAFGRTFDRAGASLSTDGGYLGVDVSREGPDETVVTIREGDYLVDQIAWTGRSLTQTTGRVREIWEDHPWKTRRVTIRVDDIGVGGGLTDNLRGLKCPTVGVDVRRSATDKRFFNLRSEANIQMRERRFVPGAISIAPRLRSSPLIDEATTLRVEFSGVGEKLQVEPKLAYKARTGKSPDYWDSLVLAFLTVDNPARLVLDAFRRRVEGENAREQTDHT